MKKGFTLVELAIVLVIIGLLVGGVLQGQELIKQAQIRQEIRKLNDFKLALAAFQTKYDGLPGDIRKPTRFFPECNDGTPVEGNGSGLIGDALINEQVCVWMHLQNSGLYNPIGYKQGGIISPNVPPQDINFETDSYSMTRWGDANALIAVSGPEAGLSVGNWLQVMGARSDGHSVPSYMAYDIYSIDSKMDDGKPGSGVIRSSMYEISAPSDDCYDEPNDLMPTTDSRYLIEVEGKNCMLAFRP